jgi:hypothetical protein
VRCDNCSAGVLIYATVVKLMGRSLNVRKCEFKGRCANSRRGVVDKDSMDQFNWRSVNVRVDGPI